MCLMDAWDNGIYLFNVVVVISNYIPFESFIAVP